MTKDEALKLALEGIKNSAEYRIGNPAYEQIEAKIEEALMSVPDGAQSEQCEYCKRGLKTMCLCGIKTQPKEPEQEPVAWMGIDIEGNPNKFRLNFFSGAIPLFTTPEDKSLIATNEKKGSPCPEFWGWLPKAYNFEGDGAFTKYNMEVAFLAGKQSVATNDTSKERVDEMQKHRHDTTPPQRLPLTDEQIAHATAPVFMGGNPSLTGIARAIEAAHGIKGEA